MQWEEDVRFDSGVLGWSVSRHLGACGPKPLARSRESSIRCRAS